MREVDFDLLAKLYSADDFDYSAVQSKYPSKVCPLCNKQFIPNGRCASRQQYCNRTHYINCAICGKPVPQQKPSKYKSEIKQACPGTCSNKLRQARTQAAIKAKYGVDNISQSSEFKEKISAGIKAKAPQSVEKMKATMNERYGGMGTQSPILRKKIENTMMKRYGVINPDELPEFRDKIRQKLSSDECADKRKQASHRNWGTDYPTQSDIIQAKMRDTCQARYGVPYVGMLPEVRDRAKITCSERYGVPYGFHTLAAKLKATDSMLSHRTGRVSAVNLAFGECLKAANIEFVNEFYLAGKWFDICIPSSNIVVEIDPSYTHSEIKNHWGSSVDQDYHIERTELAAENGYKCIHVFDWDNWDSIISLVQLKQKIFARNCEVEEVNPASVKEFIAANHIQGDARGAKAAYVLKHEGQIISAMTFSKPRYTNKYEWELLRLCSAPGISITGGPSKMFKQFVRDYSPNSVISYCDRAKFSGSVYSKIGMQLHHTTKPSKVWSKGPDKITDNLLRQRGFDQLFNTNFGKGTSNEQLMLEHSWLPVYDCGQLVFEWKKE